MIDLIKFIYVGFFLIGIALTLINLISYIQYRVKQKINKRSVFSSSKKAFAIWINCSRKQQLGPYIMRNYQHILSKSTNLHEEEFCCQRCGQNLNLSVIPVVELSWNKRALLQFKILFIPMCLITLISLFYHWAPMETPPFILLFTGPAAIITGIFIGIRYTLREHPFDQIFSGRIRPRCKFQVQDKKNSYIHEIGKIGSIVDNSEKEVPITPVVQKTLILGCVRGEKALTPGFGELARTEVLYNTAPLKFNLGGVNAQRLEKRNCPVCGELLDFYVNGDEQLRFSDRDMHLVGSMHRFFEIM